jgi:hypothetical protein
MFELLTIATAVCAVGLVLFAYRGLLRRRLMRAIPGLGSAQLGVFERVTAQAQSLARKRPWQPIRFALDDIEMGEAGFRLRAAGTDGTRPFGFGLSLAMQQRPVAVCDWSRTGSESDVFLDILASFADQPRGDRQFADVVRTSAVVLYAKPNNVSIPQIKEIQSKVFFELAENQPELYLNFDFAQRTGHILEKDVLYRRDLVGAFSAQQPAQAT